MQPKLCLKLTEREFDGLFPIFFHSQGASTFKEAMRMGAEVYQNLKKVVKSRYGIDGKVFEILRGI